MQTTKVLQGFMGILLCSVHGLLGSALDCSDMAGTRCSISVEKLLDRAIQHAELIYRVSEEARTLFEEMFIPQIANQGHGGYTCTSQLVHVPISKLGVEQISDESLLQSVWMLIQYWIVPLADLQDSLDQYDNSPSSLLDKTGWMLTKLMNLKQGVLILVSKMLDEGSLKVESNESATNHVVPFPVGTLEHVLRDYGTLSCFKKDAHKMETFLKLLKCRQTDKLSCSLF